MSAAAGGRTDRRTLHWDRVRTPRDRLALFVATGFLSGLAPRAPGTFGTLVAVPLCYATAPLPLAARSTLWLGLLAVGTWATAHFDRQMGTSDNQNVTIDEVLGFGLTAWTAGRDPLALAVAFALFRAFDVLKPPPVRQIDRWSHRQSARGGTLGAWIAGFGVIADDLAAGALGLLVMLLLQRQGILP